MHSLAAYTCSAMSAATGVHDDQGIEALDHYTRPEEVPPPRGASTKAARRRPLVILAACFLISRLAYLAAGVRFDMAPLRGGWINDPWQLLDHQQLQHHLVVSVWNLNSQPPLFNVFCGVLLKLPYGIQEPVAALTFLALGLVMVLSVYSIMVELRVVKWLALVVTVLVIVDPAYILYENWLSYGYPTAACLSVSALCLIRYVRTRERRWGIGFFSALALVALWNSTYQLIWLAAALVLVLLAIRSQWRSVLAVAVLPLLVIVGWVAKDAAQVGTVTTSSWLGMNLTRTTLDTASPAQLKAMVRQHILTPLAEENAFAPVSAYVPRYTKAIHTGLAVLDAPYKSDMAPNYNNPIYPVISRQYLHEDLAFIRARPGKYAITVVNAAKQWSTPPDEYDFVRINRARISTWANLFDRTVLLRPAADPTHVIGTTSPHEGPGAAQLSYVNILIYACAIFGSPFLAWRRRKSDPGAAATMAFLWMTTVYAFVTTSLLEFGENQRFAMELGPLPLIAAIVVIASLVGALPARFSWRRAPAHRPPRGRLL